MFSRYIIDCIRHGHCGTSELAVMAEIEADFQHAVATADNRVPVDREARFYLALFRLKHVGSDAEGNHTVAAHNCAVFPNLHAFLTRTPHTFLESSSTRHFCNVSRTV